MRIASPPAESYLSADLAAAFRKASGITGRLYDWQAECLTRDGVLNVRPGLWGCRPGLSRAGGRLCVQQHAGAWPISCVRPLQAPVACELLPTLPPSVRQQGRNLVLRPNQRRLAHFTIALHSFSHTCIVALLSRLQGRNLVYCAPTSGGKSLVAEVLMLRRILTTNRPAMLVLPFVSICSEKSEHLRCDVLVEDCCAILAD